MKRERVQTQISNGPFLAPDKIRPFFSTGCTVLDLHLGGGWSEGQIIQIAGDSKTGKSLLAIEAAANFIHKHKDEKPIVRYIDTENAFDDAYVESLGIRVKQLQLPDSDEVSHTVEAVIKDVEQYFASANKNRPMLYIVDSWDGLSDTAELKRKVDDSAGYGQAKAKKGKEFGRRILNRCDKYGFTLMLVQQVYDNIGVMFGEKKKAMGGNWINFYSTQRVWLKSGAPLSNSRAGHKRQYGVITTAKIKKNRREWIGGNAIAVPIIYSYGVDDLMACVRYLLDEEQASRMFEGKSKAAKEAAEAFIKKIWKLDREKYDAYLDEARTAVTELYGEIKEVFKPKRSKY